jgi:VWFA-related protein
VRPAPDHPNTVAQSDSPTATALLLDRLFHRSAVPRSSDLAGAQGVGDAQREPGPWTRELERQNDLLASRQSAALGRLARETGGFLLENTNDLGAGVSRMQQERTAYYLLAYQPTNTAADGKFRRVRVRVKRPGVTLRGRPGYTAPTVATGR